MRTSGHKARLSETASRMAAEAGMGGSSSVLRLDSAGRTECVMSTVHAGAQGVNKHGGPQSQKASISVKTPEYSGEADWEAFHAQFELLSHSGEWSDEDKALQLCASRTMLCSV